MTDISVGEWCKVNKGDCIVSLGGEWRIGVIRGMYNEFELISPENSEDIFFLRWRGFTIRRAVHLVCRQLVDALVEELRGSLLKLVWEHLRVEHARIDTELQELGALEVALLGASL